MEPISLEDDEFPVNEVVARVSEYLRCLGLPVNHARTQAMAAVERCAARGAGADLDASLGDIMSQFDAWLTHLCEASGRSTRCSPGLLAWHVRPLLAKRPDVFLLEGELGEWPEAVRLAVEAATQCALPEPTPTPMPAQSFGPVPQVFHSGFWRGIAAQLASGGRGLLRRIKRRASSHD